MIEKSELSNFKTFVKYIEQAIYGKKRTVRRNKPTNKTTIKKPNEQMALGEEKQRTENIPTIDTESNAIKENTKSKAKGKIFNSDNFLQKTIT